MRPAFYALSPGGWRDYLTLLHPPYTLWHLSYVIWGAALAGGHHYDRLAATLVAFFLAVGVAAHALDELQGRPLGTRISSGVLVVLASVSLGGAVLIGVLGAVEVSPWLLVFVVCGLFIAPAYNLEWFGGRFHSDTWFAVSWGAFPLLAAYFVTAERLSITAALGAAMAFTLSLAQRTLSERVRGLRRRARSIEGRVYYSDGTVEDIDRRWATVSDERALLLISASIFAGGLAVLMAFR
ncbi:MAG: UbiA prenyltransferase family protein [Chloroflexi bacterium]|nr:UbiA prenyltransferase family protein [Chloroflexota bacterium]MCI0817982.1 UbiA prenyltransferase family protein [Chloroflexota bacterium]MCI0832438.1 UbiA prenyltransferase family protein [Chloroflexota bacterium]MCI0839496.1 UbiA prenyltransferase family protein [Chloroflexota bacterium]MCI0885780.1 UbiA prenyltransferase family protein [Chloroflexota bacterium]